MAEDRGRAAWSGKDAIKAVQKYERLIKAALFALVPLVCCMVACAVEGRSIGQVYLPASEWNDELFYFKQVEGILNFGYPQGYFGFNESHALKLSFAAWSPVLVFPWILWGLLFGWSLMSPVYCNIFLMMLALFIFAYMVRPGIKQLALITVLFAAFTPLTRFMLSGMPEVICFSMVVIFLALGITCGRRYKTWKLALMLAMVSVMTLMRPYLLIFIILPAYYWVKKNRVWGIAGSFLVLAATGGIYACVKYYLGAEYFAPLFDITWIEKFLQEGIFAGVKYALYRLWDVGRTFTAMMIEGFKSGLPAGAQFGGFMLLMALLWIQSGIDFAKKRKEQLALHLSMAVCFLGMLTALLLMYKPKEGGRHLMTFIVAGIFLLGLMETKFYRKAILSAGVFAYLFSVMALDPYEYQIPFRMEEREQALEEWKEIFNEKLSLSLENTPNFDNVIIWTFSDEVEGETRALKWQELYALPKGFGISCCYKEYVEDNFESLQSRYLAVPLGGSLDERCREEKHKEVGRSGEVIIYELR